MRRVVRQDTAQMQKFCLERSYIRVFTPSWAAALESNQQGADFVLRVLLPKAQPVWTKRDRGH